jgi:cytochrome c-type biogenesis protein
VIGSVGHTVSQGSVLLALPIAAVAGLLSFVSPCVLPLVPGYLSFLGGAVGAEAAASDTKRVSARTVLGSVAFVLGFTIVFVAYLWCSHGGLGYVFRWVSAWCVNAQ